jgi:hypothetical protein
VKDYRNHAVATHFGQVTVRLPRFRCAGCGAIEAGAGWPSHCHSIPELDQLQAHFSALMPYRVAADVLKQVFPVDAGKDPETLRRHALKIGGALRNDAVATPEKAVAAIGVTLDSTFIRSLRMASASIASSWAARYPRQTGYCVGFIPRDLVKRHDHLVNYNLNAVYVAITATGTRRERDSTDFIDVPADRYWGARTQRALEAFPGASERLPERFFRCYGYVKRAAAIVNAQAERLPLWKAAAIAMAANDLIAGLLADQFPRSVWQSGSGHERRYERERGARQPSRPAPRRYSWDGGTD